MWQLWIVIGWLALGAVVAVAMVGKPRQPLTGKTAAVCVVITTALVVLMIWAMGAAK